MDCQNGAYSSPPSRGTEARGMQRSPSHTAPRRQSWDSNPALPTRNSHIHSAASCLPWQPRASCLSSSCPFSFQIGVWAVMVSSLYVLFDIKYSSTLTCTIPWDEATCHGFNTDIQQRFFFSFPENEMTSWTKVKTTFCIEISKGPELLTQSWRPLVTIIVYYTMMKGRRARGTQWWFPIRVGMNNNHPRPPILITFTPRLPPDFCQFQWGGHRPRVRHLLITQLLIAHCSSNQDTKSHDPK